VQKRSISVAGKHSSVSLEDCFWQAFKALAAARSMTAGALARDIGQAAGKGNLSSAIRVHLFEQYTRQAAGPRDGCPACGHRFDAIPGRTDEQVC
jgi:predicted DNA-binding ribbon-helix-helix protein